MGEPVWLGELEWKGNNPERDKKMTRPRYTDTTHAGKCDACIFKKASSRSDSGMGWGWGWGRLNGFSTSLTLTFKINCLTTVTTSLALSSSPTGKNYIVTGHGERRVPAENENPQVWRSQDTTCPCTGLLLATEGPKWGSKKPPSPRPCAFQIQKHSNSSLQGPAPSEMYWYSQRGREARGPHELSAFTHDSNLP